MYYICLSFRTCFFTPTLSGSWNDYLCEQEKYEANITNFLKYPG